jgi:hypothetical protein
MQKHNKKRQKWRYINLNPSTPCLYGTIKLHEQSKPIRPIVNWKNSPAYKIAKNFNKILQNILQLPHTFNVKNLQESKSYKLTKTGKDSKFPQNLRRISLLPTTGE